MTGLPGCFHSSGARPVSWAVPRPAAGRHQVQGLAGDTGSCLPLCNPDACRLRKAATPQVSRGPHPYRTPPAGEPRPLAALHPARGSGLTPRAPPCHPQPHPTPSTHPSQGPCHICVRPAWVPHQLSPPQWGELAPSLFVSPPPHPAGASRFLTVPWMGGCVCPPPTAPPGWQGGLCHHHPWCPACPCISWVPVRLCTDRDRPLPVT